MSVYVKRQCYVEAIQFKGVENVRKVQEFLGKDCSTLMFDDMLAVNGDFIVPKNYYIVKENGDYAIYNQKMFERNYYPFSSFERRV